MTLFSRRIVLALAGAAVLAPAAALAADKPKEIRIDWATYNPVSMLLKDKGLMEKEFAKDGISIRWVQTLAADKPKEIRIDWATYNPVSMLLKDKGLMEKEFAKDGISIRWVQTLGSNKALEFLN